MEKFALIAALFAAMAAGAADTTLNGPIVPSGGVSWPSGPVGTTAITFTLALDPTVAPTITVYNNGSAPVYCASGPSTVTVTASKWSAIIPPAATNGAAGWASWQDSTKPTTVACVSTAAGNGVIITQSLGAPVAARGGGGGGGGGGGAVNSVGASSPLTSSGGANPVISVVNTSPNQILAGPASGGAQGAVTARSLVGADLPTPTTTALGGVKANAGTAGQFVSGIASDGSLTYATPSGGGSSVSVDGVAVQNPNFADSTSQTNAINFIASGSTVNAQLSPITNITAASISLTDTSATANTVTIDAPVTLINSYEVTLPTAVCSSGQVWWFTNSTGTLGCANLPTGTVTSVQGSGGTTGLTFSGGPITGSGTLTLGGILNVANGGTGTATPGLVAGTNVTITGNWPNQTIAASGGGTGSVNLSSPNATLAISGTAPNYTLDIAQQAATSGQVLAWNGTKFAPATPAASGVSSVTGNIVSGTAANPIVTQVQPDWNASTGLGVILNKPTIPSAGVQSVTGNIVGGTATNPVVTQVQPDWSASTGLGTILNKPTIPAAQVNSDWNATSGVAQILNKPTIPAAGVATVTGNIVAGTATNPVVTQVQPDWNASAGLGTILNKPTVLNSGSIAAIADGEIALNVGGSAGGFPVNAVIDTTTAPVTINSTSVTVTNSLNSAAATVSALTGQVNPVVNTTYTPLAAYSKLGVGAFGSGGTLTVTSYSYTSATQVVAALSGTSTQVNNIFTDSAGAAVKSSTVYAGPSTFGTFAFKPGPAAAIAALAPGVSLTTTGVTGAATLTSGVLNIPQYTRSPNANSNHVSGTSAGAAITTGIYDTIFGSFAGQNLNSGGYNTFIGNGAGELTTTPSFNTFIGAIAGTSNSTGEKNACLGYRCLYSNTTVRGVSSIGGWPGDGQSNRVVLSDGDAQVALYSKTPITGGDQTTYTLLNGRTAQSSGGSLEVPGSVVFQPPTASPTLGTNLDAAIWLNGAVPTLARRDASGTTTQYPLSGGGTGGAAGTTSVSWVQSTAASSPYIINVGQVSASVIMPISVASSTNLYQSNTGNGTIAGTRYIGAQPTSQTGYVSALQFPTSLTAGGYFTDFRVSIPSFTTRVVMSAGSVPTTASVYVGIGKASAIAASQDPLNDANVLPWFDVAGNDPNPLPSLIKPTVTVAAVSGQANTYDITVTGGTWYGGGTAPAYAGSTTDWLPFIQVTPIGSPSVVLSSITSASVTNFNMVTALGLQGSAGGGGTVPTMQAANNAGNTISNADGGQGSTTWSSPSSTNYTTVQGSSIRTSRVDLADGSGSNTVSLAGPVPNATYRIVLPPDAPTATNQVMSVSTIAGQNYATAWTTPAGSSRQICVFRVAETSSASGAQLFTVGARGGSVTSSVTGCGVTAPASGASNWSFPAGNYIITASIDYTAIGAGAQTIITNFGISSSVAGSGGTQVLYSVGSKTQPASDDINSLGMQYMSFASTSNLYLTRFAGSSAGASTAQITASGNAQLIIEKLP